MDTAPFHVSGLALLRCCCRDDEPESNGQVSKPALDPILHTDAGHALELAGVVRNDDETLGSRVGTDQHVMRSSRISNALQCSAHLAVMDSRLRRERQHLEPRREMLDRLKIFG